MKLGYIVFTGGLNLASCCIRPKQAGFGNILGLPKRFGQQCPPLHQPNFSDTSAVGGTAPEAPATTPVLEGSGSMFD